MSTDLIQRLRFLASGQDDAHSKAIDEAADELERKSDAIQRLWAERDQLRAEVEALRADAERLDYLEKTGSTVEVLPPLAPWHFRVGGLRRSYASSIRDAIDAARKG